jgi:hypothetical protein
MAPELLNGERPTLASDVYAFAVTMSEVNGAFGCKAESSE